ncbi:MAG: hypothetical protein CL910_05600 [Deltaproteobacteria bacterium]|nr:hypothetical protein [Deltaproteobacteria bacterium]
MNDALKSSVPDPEQAAAPPEPGPEEVRLPDPQVADPISAMVARYNLFFRWFARRFFRHLDIDDQTAERLRSLEERGAVVYVMRYASRLDYFLFNTLLARKGLRLSAFANGLSFYYYQPVWAALQRWWERLQVPRKDRWSADRQRALEKAREVVRSGESMFLFLRTARLSSVLHGREAAVERGRREQDLLAEVVHTARQEGHEVALVPLALFWRKGPRSSRRFLNLTYGAPTRPTDIAKVTSFLLTYRDLSMRFGEQINLRAFLASQEGTPRILIKKLRRVIQLFLYREERGVEGPTLRPRHRVQEMVLGHPEVTRAVAARAEDPKTTPEAARAEAEKVFREIAANMNSTTLAILYVLVGWIFRKLFHSIEISGLERVSELAKQRPVVLVPSHRSYFDFLILSWLFYGNHCTPPHIAARDNMGFGPFGPIFRWVGAFYLRKSFDDDLYKAVFRSYIGYLVKEGFTQEFFIEGGRSRTGKSLAPRMGMLSWNIQGFVDSGRQDLIFVPVGITYERLVEEGAMVDELEGGSKQQESVLGLMRARKVLQRRFGSVFVRFGEAVSLAKALGENRELFLGAETPEQVAQKRIFTESLANDLVERINWSIVANATSVAACALLGEPRRGVFRHELVQRMTEVVELLRLQDVQLTPALLADEPEFNDSITFLLRSGLIKSEEDPRGEILFYEDSHRRALDVYRNVLFHFLMAPSLIAAQVLRGTTKEELARDLDFWLDLLYREFFAPKALVKAAQQDAFLDYFERAGVLERSEERLVATEKGRPYFAFLAQQTRSLLEAYHAAFSVIAASEEPQTVKQLEKDAEQHFRRAHLIGEVQRTEGWNPVTFRNALELLARRGIVEKQAPEGRGEARYARGEAFEDLSSLLARLAGALGAR